MTAPAPMPSSLILFAISFCILLAFVLLLWLINAVKERLQRPKSQKPYSTSARTPSQTPGATPAPQQIGAPSMLPLREWLDRVNNQPDRVPHIAAKGPSGSGKTTLILAALTERPGKVLVCTPKNERDDSWGGAPAVRLTADLTFDAIESALQSVHHEVKRRNVEGFDDWLTVVIDDYPWIAQECPSAAKVVTMVGNMGRSVRVRLILLAQTATVKSWGFEGNGEARGNFVFIDLEEDHSAAIYRWAKQPEPIDTRCVAELASQPIPAARWWRLAPLSELGSPTTAAVPSVGLSPEHVARVTTWLIYEPNISTREIARRLYPGTDGGGDYSTRAKAVRVFVEPVLEEALLAVRTPNNRLEAALANGLTA